LDVCADQPDGVRFGYRILKVPTLLGLLTESDELFTRGNAEDSMIFVLSAILQLDCAREPNRSEKRPTEPMNCEMRDDDRSANDTTRKNSMEEGRHRVETTHQVSPK